MVGERNSIVIRRSYFLDARILIFNFYRFKGVEVELVSVKPQFNPEAPRMAFYDHFILFFF